MAESPLHVAPPSLSLRTKFLTTCFSDDFWLAHEWPLPVTLRSGHLGPGGDLGRDSASWAGALTSQGPQLPVGADCGASLGAALFGMCRLSEQP